MTAVIDSASKANALARMDSIRIDALQTLYNNLEAANETMIAAHLNSFVWDVLYNIYFPDMNVTAEYAADLIQKRILETVRKALAELYEADGDA